MEQDSEAIRRCCDGDIDSFGAIVRRYEREALAHARAIVRNHEDALEAVQEAFVDAFRAINSFDTGKAFYPWFYVILRNRCYGILKARQRRSALSLDACRDQMLACDDRIGSRLEDVEEALLELGAEDREIIVLKYVDCLTYRELAERLEIPIGTVMSRLFYARRRLREKLMP